MNIEFLNNLRLWEWVLFLVLLWLFVIWVISRYKSRYRRRHLTFSREYFQGLNYLLNDEQDKAVDIFLQLVEADWKAIDTGLSLGNIFRRKGEFDKAIKLHHDLLSRPSLPDEFKSRLMLELGRDYHLAGLLDRAEGLFNDLAQDEYHACEALFYLMDIYQKEQEWQSAIDVGLQHMQGCKKNVRPLVAQFYCSLSDEKSVQHQLQDAEVLANQALSVDAACVRALIILADICIKREQHQQAIGHLQQIEKHDNALMPLVMERLVTCYQHTADLKSLVNYLRQLERRSEKLDLASHLSRLIEDAYGHEAALEYLTARMLVNPTLDGMNTLLELKNKDKDAPQDFMPLIVQNLLRKQPVYQCNRCGYSANTHYWLCPGCQTWSSMRPRVMNQKSGLMYE